jgi:hypothetical protein
MTIPVRTLAMAEETLRHEQVEFVPGACHGDIKKTPLLLDFGVRACGEIRRDASVDDVQHKDRPPFLTLGRMDGRENQIILIQKRNPSVVAGRIGWVERQLGQEVLSRPIAGGDPLELD